MLRSRIAAFWCATLLACGTPASFGQQQAAKDYPSKPIRLVVPFAAGGTLDVIGHTLGQKIAPAIGQNLFIDNRPGAGGAIGTSAVVNAGGQLVSLVLGASFFDSVTSFEMVRGGRIDSVILGAYEVDQHANLANWSSSDVTRGGIGSAMGLVAGNAEPIVLMEHCDSENRPKLRRECTYPRKGKGCVNWVVTDLALLRWQGGRFVLEEVAPGFTPSEVMELTEMEIVASSNVRTMD